MINIRNLDVKENLGVKFKDSIFNELVFLQYHWVRMILKATGPKKGSKQSLPKVNFKKPVQKSIVELWTDISNQMIKYQLPHTRFDKIGDHKHDIYICIEYYPPS